MFVTRGAISGIVPTSDVRGWDETRIEGTFITGDRARSRNSTVSCFFFLFCIVLFFFFFLKVCSIYVTIKHMALVVFVLLKT